MEELKTFLIKAKDEYYKGNPIIPDEVYDRLEEQVEGFKVHTLERNHRHEIVTPILEVYKTFRD